MSFMLGLGMPKIHLPGSVTIYTHIYTLPHASVPHASADARKIHSQHRQTDMHVNMHTPPHAHKFYPNLFHRPKTHTRVHNSELYNLAK